ncbi:MAG: hypothetical protein ACJ75H_16325 [Thermoanaerobaculia bacterium]
MEADGAQERICIRAYASRAEAEYAQALLASQGIACELASASAGIRLLVTLDDAGDADEVLSDVIEG